ncbi:MAG: N-acyl-L-homoserine lactone synthetase [Rhodobacterales bacterium]|nr:MAG: N-acyl-L-homoserine lactone synthetase [Rhodobacterales bacterium]
MPGAIETNDSKAWVFPKLESGAAGPLASARFPGLTPTPPDSVPEIDRHIHATTITFRTMSQHGDLLVSYLEARKQIFIDTLKWNIPSVDGMEFDQYDTPYAHWVVIHEFGRILGGVRLMPTKARCGIYSYMLRDAQLGLLHPIPRDVLFLDAPVDERVWEASRLFITGEVPALRRAQVQGLLMQQMAMTAGREGATHVIGIVPAVFARWLRRLDLEAVPVGRRFEIDGTRSQAALFKVAQTLH